MLDQHVGEFRSRSATICMIQQMSIQMFVQYTCELCSFRLLPINNLPDLMIEMGCELFAVFHPIVDYANTSMFCISSIRSPSVNLLNEP